VQNAEAYFSGKIDDFDQVGIQAINEYCLEITLEHPVPYFLELLMHGAWYPVHEDTIEKFGDIDKRDTPWIKPGNMVCNGPFILKSWENDSHISVVKNPYYWDKGSIALERISFHPISDTAVEERMYASGDLDITYRVHVSKLEHYKKTGELYLSPYLGCMWVTMNCAKKPFDDIRVRKALALAINRKEIGKVRGIGDGFEAYGVVPPETLHYKQQPRLFEEDIQEAKRLLAEAGYPNAKGFPEVEVLYNTSDLHRSVFEALQAMWKKNLNIRINLLSQEWKVYLMLKKQGDFSLTRYAWIGDYNDPSSLMDIFQSDSPNNDSRWCSLRYDYLLFQAKTAINEEKRIKLLQEAERIFVQEMPAIPVYWETSSHLVSPHVKGWFPNVMDIHPWKCVSKVECK
jgi:oligopeptide transport system substrate-binding protein